jgi:hypothetical protein
VRDRAVPGHVVAGPELDLVLALAHPPAPAKDEVVLLARVCVGSGREAGPEADLEHREAARQAAVDPLDVAAVENIRLRALARAHYPRRHDLVDEQPGRRDVQRFGDRAEGVERRRGLLVLDLRQVAEVQAAPLRETGEGQAALEPPAPDLAPDGDPAPTTAGSGARLGRGGVSRLHVVSLQTSLDTGKAYVYCTTDNQQ